VSTDLVPVPEAKISHWDHEADVVIAGYGIAGAAAAVEAARAGADVLVLERTGSWGGAAAMAGGFIYLGGGTALQTACGFSDSVDNMAAFLNAAMGPGADEARIADYCAGSVAHFDWLVDCGVTFKSEFFGEPGWDILLALYVIDDVERWMSIAELTSAGVNGELYMHEIYDLNPGESRSMLELVADVAVPAYNAHGAQLVGAFRTGLVDDRECIVLWALPDWAAWARFETANDTAVELRSWRERARRHVRRTHRCLMVDAPLSPFRTGRQPQVSDRVPLV